MTSTLIRTSSKARSVTILTDGKIKDEFGNLEETKKAVERAINRARKTKSTNNTTTNSIGNDRRFAQALHQEADQLYQKGDYETALVLYHRAANVCPRDASHNSAARRTATMINSWQNPSKRLRKFMSKTNPVESELTIALCPEAAAIKAANVLKQSPDFSSVNQVLSYFDEHKNLWNGLSTSTSSISRLRLTRSNALLNRMRIVADTTLKKLETAFHTGNVNASFQYAKELLTVSSGIGEPKRYEIEAHRYLALTHVMLGRHDRAVNNVAKMVYLAKISKDSILMSQALVTLGKVHLSFDHLDAAARAWEHLSKNLEEPILRGWINHEIGRCYLETGKFMKAFNMGSRTLEIAKDIGSNKWILHGKLLRAQALVKLGRFSEALEELRICARISEEEGDTPTLSYIQNLIVDLTGLLRRITFRSRTEEDLEEDEEEKSRDSSTMENDTISLCSSSRRLEEEEVNEQIIRTSTSRSFRNEKNNRFDLENPTNTEIRLTNSTTSLKSQITNATYVIDKTTPMQHQIEMGRKNDTENLKESSNECIFDNEDSQEKSLCYLKEIDKINSEEESESIDESSEMLQRWEKIQEEEVKVEEERSKDPEKMIEIIRIALSMSKEEVSSIEEVQVVQKPTSTTTTTTTMTTTIDKTDSEFRCRKSREDGRRNDVGDSITRGRMHPDFAGRSSFTKNNR